MKAFEDLKVHLALRDTTVRFCEKVFVMFMNKEGKLEELVEVWGLRKAILSPLSFLEFTLKSYRHGMF